MADLDLSTLKAYTPLFPMLIKKYEQFVPDQNASVLDKINSIIAELNAIGQLSNNVVKDWNTVYQWCMNDGLQTDVNNKLEDMRTNGEISDILSNIFDNLAGDMTTLHTEAKDKLVNSINEVDDLAKLNQTNIGDLTTLTTTDKGNLVAAINNNVASLAQITTINIENFQRIVPEADDNGRFSRAISALSGKAGKIIMPALNYTISQPIIVNGFRLCGDSKQTTITYTGTDSAIKTPLTGYIRHAEVSNVNIVCTNTTALAMYLKGFHMSRFADINTNAPIYINGDNGAYYNLFENIYVYALNQSYGIQIDSPTNTGDKMTSTTFINVHVFGYTGGASTLGKGWLINYATGLTFIKCYAEGCTEGFYSNNQYNTFINCSVETSATGFELTSNAGYGSLIGCYAFGATTALINNATNTTIIGGGLPNYLNLSISDLMTVSSSVADPFVNLVNGRYKNLQVKNKFDANKTFIVTNTTDSIDMLWCSSAGVLTAQGIIVPTLASLPTASSTYRNRIATVLGNGTTTSDITYICLMSSTGTYSWKQLISG